MTPAKVNTLVAILGRLGSEYPGEVISAALHAIKLLKSENETWETLLQPRVAYQAPKPSSATWRTDLDLCQRYRPFASLWEQGFITTVSGQPALSSKQRLILSEIAAKLRARGWS